MRLALDLAAEARRSGEVPIGAVVVIGGEVVGTGRNANISAVDPTAHAEIVGLRAAAARIGNHRLVGATLYCTVEPCLMCLGATLHARIDRIVYGATDPKIGAIDMLDRLRSEGAEFNHLPEVVAGVLAGEASRLLVGFFQERRGACGARAVNG